MPAKRAKTTKAKTAKPKTTKVKKATAKVQAVTQKPTKTQLFGWISEDTGLTKKEIVSVFDSLGDIIKGSLIQKGCGELTLPFGVKIRRIKKKATKKREGVNPFTGEPMTIAAKPARKAVKVSVLKSLKEVVE